MKYGIIERKEGKINDSMKTSACKSGISGMGDLGFKK
jgi:hypothetical protein